LGALFRNAAAASFCVIDLWSDSGTDSVTSF